ncbi:hypothetical protein BG003_011565 [Podila horticola]|nr:hypothetical protein BG003_011565 [Podila horticola]
MRTTLFSFFSLATLLASSALAVPVAPASTGHGVTIHIIENALPTASQTHEVLSIPDRKTLLVSQMSDSVLVKARVNNDGQVTGLAAFQIGSPTSQLHGLAHSKRYPGKVWVTLQSDNLLVLIDPRAHSLRSAPRVIKEIKVPEGKGPHYVGEYGDDLWVSLQDSSAVLRINHVNPNDYDHYQGLPRPVFVAQHPINKHFYSGEDNSSKLFKINPFTKKTSQIDVPTTLKSQLGKNASLLHLTFDKKADSNKTLWLLSSSITDSNALDMIIKVTFNADWTKIESEEVNVLPTQNDKAHRIIQTAANQFFATELATSKLVSFRPT